MKWEPTLRNHEFLLVSNDDRYLAKIRKYGCWHVYVSIHEGLSWKPCTVMPCKKSAMDEAERLVLVEML